jgi:hypothetical protein
VAAEVFMLTPWIRSFVLGSQMAGQSAGST